MLGYCEKCNLVFNAMGAIKSVSGGSVRIRNSFTNCPNCNNVASLLDGTYDLSEEGIIKITSAPQFTIDVINQFKQLTQKAIRENYSREQFQNEAEKISKESGLVAKYLTRDNVRDFFLILSFLLALLEFYSNKKETPSNNIYNLNVSVGNNKSTPPNAGKGSNYTHPKKKRKKK
jgi:hypothetical protein